MAHRFVTSQFLQLPTGLVSLIATLGVVGAFSSLRHVNEDKKGYLKGVVVFLKK